MHKNELLDKMEENHFERNSQMEKRFSNAITMQQEQLEMKNKLDDKLKRIAELESVLNTANMRFETESKKSLQLIQENTKVKKLIKELEF